MDIQIMKLLSDGYTVPEVCQELNKKQREVEYRIEVLKDRLNCSTITHLVCIYLRKRLID